MPPFIAFVSQSSQQKLAMSYIPNMDQEKSTLFRSVFYYKARFHKDDVVHSDALHPSIFSSQWVGTVFTCPVSIGAISPLLQ